MSRRHKETEETKDYKPQQAESHADGSPRVKGLSLFGLSFKKFSITKRDGSKNRFSLSKITDAIRKAFEKEEVEIDDEWVKIPRRYFDFGKEYDYARNSDSTAEYLDESRPHRGRSFKDRLIYLFDDSEPIRWFKETLSKVKTNAKQLFKGMTQFSVCFLKSLYEAFLPHGDPYQSVSHYHRILAEENVPNLPSRVTINRNYLWFVRWHESVTFEDRKAKNNRQKHRLWERLVKWIKEFLLKLAPQYAPPYALEYI